MKMTGRLTGFLSVLTLTFGLTSSYADATSAVGKWQTRDDNTGKPNSVITIWQIDGKYFGRISKIYPVNGAQTSDICVKCKGEKHNQPMLGLVIIENAVLQGQKYVGGRILDPRDGKIYHCTLEVGKDGKILKVRGYIGMPIFGKSKIWYRM